MRLWQGEVLDPDLEDAFLPAAREIGDPQVLVPALAVAAMLRTASDRPEAAHQVVRELISFDSDPRGWITSTYLADLGGVVRDQPSLARALLDRVTAPARLAELGRLTVRAILAEVTSRLDEAAALYAEAAAGWETFGAPPLQARCLLDEGRCLLQLGHDGAVTALAEARDRAARLGARGLEAEAATSRARHVERLAKLPPARQRSPQ